MEIEYQPNRHKYSIRSWCQRRKCDYRAVNYAETGKTVACCTQIWPFWNRANSINSYDSPLYLGLFDRPISAQFFAPIRNFLSISDWKLFSAQ